MLEKTTEELNENAGDNTTTEIKQQPELWLYTLNIDTETLEQMTAWVEAAAKLGEDVVARESEIAEFLSGDFNRVTYLGSGWARTLSLASLRSPSSSLVTSTA